MKRDSYPFYRIHICSQDVVRGDFRDGWYYINMAEFLDDYEYQISLESFYNNNAISLPCFNVESATLTQGNNFSTTGRGLTNIIATINSNIVDRTVDFYTIGSVITNPTILRSSLINIRFTNIAGTLIASSDFGATPVWKMTLIVYPIQQC